MNLKDNNFQGKEIDWSKYCEKDIRYFSEITIAELANKDGENLLIFPHCLNAQHIDIDEQNTILKVKGNKIITSNYMGFISRNSTEITIRSRFDKGDSNFFMHYMLQKVFAVNIFNMQISKGQQSVWDFLIYLFPYYLKKALRQGVYKKYQRNYYNDTRVKGTIDVSRHIKENIPFSGAIAYSTRQHSYDNNVTQLIRHTIEYISTHKFGGRGILQCDNDVRQAVNQIVLATPSYLKSNRAKIVTSNLRQERHTYYTEYSFLQKLCLQILRGDKISFGAKDKDKVYGLIFDGAWLWEEYLSTFLQPLGYIHPRNKDQTNYITLFKNNKGRSYPDFYIKGSVVLDAKYKRNNDKDNIERSDIHQIITYMHCIPASIGGLIYPQNSYVDIDSNSSISEYGSLEGYGGKVFKIYHHIKQYDNQDTYTSFIAAMRDSENILIRNLSTL
ncbi:MAG: hypothetical protein R3Y26_08465 [Rikenellaceae bacterium]